MGDKSGVWSILWRRMWVMKVEFDLCCDGECG